jgi:hypothetical protein
VDASRHRKAQVVADQLRKDPNIRHGGWCRVRVEGQNLDEFAASLRNAQGKGHLHPTTVRLLNATPGWAWDADVDRWLEVLMDLREHADVYGAAAFPPGELLIDERYLRDEAQSLRTAHRIGALPSEVVDTLDALPG